MTELFVDGEPAESIPASDRGFLYGHGLFETMRLWQGNLPLLDLHLDRLESGARTLSIVCDLKAIKHQLDFILPKLPAEGLLKLVLTAGDGLRGYPYHSTNKEVKPRCLIQYFPLDGGVSEVRLKLCEYRLPDNPRLAGIKHLNRLDQVMAAAELPPNSDGLLLDQTGNVIEALSSNLFVLYQGQWLTPSLQRSGVAGVMRQLLMEQVIPAVGLTPRCQDIDLGILQVAEEVFICNAVRGVSSVMEITGLNQTLFSAVRTPSSALTQTALIQAELGKHYPCFGE
ncbi:MAG: aminodeoxychorismate lyase [Porticoccaceae bacterium]|nr:aminodeoxychorismate lyase [Porticoccaceae bacterium]